MDKELQFGNIETQYDGWSMQSGIRNLNNLHASNNIFHWRYLYHWNNSKTGHDIGCWLLAFRNQHIVSWHIPIAVIVKRKEISARPAVDFRTIFAMLTKNLARITVEYTNWSGDFHHQLHVQNPKKIDGPKLRYLQRTVLLYPMPNQLH
jgi:hypothetical protein